MTRLGIVGGGAVGGLLAALLDRAGSDVTLIIRDTYLPAYAEGIRVQLPHERFVQMVRVQNALPPDVEVLVLAVKMPDLAPLCAQIAAQWRFPSDRPRDEGGHIPQAIVALQNGIDALDIASSYLPEPLLIGGVVELGATSLHPAEVTLTIPGRFLLGAARLSEQPRAEMVAGLLRPAFPTTVVGNIQAAQRLKLLVNLNNGIAAATGLTAQALYATSDGILCSRDVMREGLACFDTAGLLLPPGPRSLALRALVGAPDALALVLLRLAGRMLARRTSVYPSTLQSVLRKRPTEIAYLNGRIVALGKKHGVAVPRNEAVVAAVQQLSAGPAPRFTPVSQLRRPQRAV